MSAITKKPQLVLNKDDKEVKFKYTNTIKYSKFGNTVIQNLDCDHHLIINFENCKVFANTLSDGKMAVTLSLPLSDDNENVLNALKKLHISAAEALPHMDNNGKVVFKKYNNFDDLDIETKIHQVDDCQVFFNIPLKEGNNVTPTYFNNKTIIPHEKNYNQLLNKSITGLVRFRISGLYNSDNYNKNENGSLTIKAEVIIVKPFEEEDFDDLFDMM